MSSTKCGLLCVPENFDHVCSTKCRLLRVSDGLVTCVVLTRGYYVFRIIGRMCSTKCRLLCVPDSFGYKCGNEKMCRQLCICYYSDEFNGKSIKWKYMWKWLCDEQVQVYVYLNLWATCLIFERTLVKWNGLNELWKSKL